jgi:hypothetical protein
VLVAIAFGLFEIRKAREERAERAAFSVISAVMSPVWIRSLNMVLMMPEAMSVELSKLANSKDWGHFLNWKCLSPVRSTNESQPAVHP